MKTPWPPVSGWETSASGPSGRGASGREDDTGAEGDDGDDAADDASGPEVGADEGSPEHPPARSTTPSTTPGTTPAVRADTRARGMVREHAALPVPRQNRKGTVRCLTRSDMSYPPGAVRSVG